MEPEILLLKLFHFSKTPYIFVYPALSMAIKGSSSILYFITYLLCKPYTTTPWAGLRPPHIKKAYFKEIYGDSI